jgi:beta-lactamase superfamily II metal-dependent hydrolase
MRIEKRTAGLVMLLAVGMVAGAQGGATKTTSAKSGKGELQVYFVDVEGGQSTLFVAPDGESLLVDTGNPDSRNPTAPRDPARIAQMCKLAGVTKIDNLLVTHYHTDHVGGLPQLVGMIPVGRFIDHGVNRETTDVQGGNSTVAGYNAYQKVLADSHAEHLTVKPGDVLPIKAFHVEVVSGDGEVIAKPLAAGGEQNAACGLMCPVNKIGKVDVYIVSHHGLINSGSPALVDAIAPRVAIEDNGPHKGGAPSTYVRIEGTSRLKDMWQLHTAEVPDAKNVADARIANLPGPDAGNYLKLAVRMDGSLAVTNGRTGETVEYSAK